MSQVQPGQMQLELPTAEGASTWPDPIPGTPLSEYDQRGARQDQTSWTSLRAMHHCQLPFSGYSETLTYLSCGR